MKRSVLLALILGVSALSSVTEAKTIWPDTVDNREPVAYFVLKVDTTDTRLTDTTFQRSIDTTMGKRSIVALRFDSVFVSPQEFQALAVYIAGRLKGDQEQIEAKLRTGFVIDMAPPKKPKK